MKKILFALATIGLIAIACAAFAQGAFVDVPTDHWAYDAVNQLQRVGIIVGYPDGTFGGKRAMTRYEFAVAIARLLPLLNGDTVINNDVDLSGYAKKSDIPSFNGASKDDLDALRKLVGEFGDELASLGVDVDALKRDVANLTARVEALEAENRRIRFEGDFLAAAVAKKGNVNDIDNLYNGANNLLDDVTVLKNFYLRITGRASDKVTVYSTINYGDYLNYFANHYGYGVPGGDDQFYPTYLYAVAELGKTTLTAGRFPLQWTPYTLHGFDWDTYVDYYGTQDGNLAFDGIKADLAFGKSFDLEVFAAKVDQNRYGLSWIGAAQGIFPYTQSAGARAVFGLGKASLGASYYEAWSETAKAFSPGGGDTTKVYGADLKIPFGSFVFAGEYAESKFSDDKVKLGSGDAWDVSLSLATGKLNLGAGYRSVDAGFFSSAAWTKVGYYADPTNIKGWYGNLGYNFSDKFGIYGVYQDYEPENGFAFNSLKSAKGGLNFGLGSKSSFQAEYEEVRDYGYGYNRAKDIYTTLTYKYKFTPNASLRLGYQFIKEKIADFGTNEKGGVAFAQFGVSF
ncbi:MAG: S-layer homology domain-containing protein [Abditibacteriota bacterium]|nr:S-layer homology domain-containing protein [Abditibacteriota bacterium]